MSTQSPQIRPAVHRCMTLAARSAVAGDHARARSFFTLALDLANPEESSTVLQAATRLLGGLAPETTVAAGPTDAGTAAPAPEDPGPATSEGPPEEAPPPPPAPEPVAAAPAAEPPRRREPATRAPGPTRTRPAARPRRSSVSAGAFAAPALGALVVGALIWGGISVLAPDQVDIRRVEAALEAGRADVALQELEGVENAGARIDYLRGRALLSSGDTAGAVAALRAAAGSAGAEGDEGKAGAGARAILDRLDASARAAAPEGAAESY